MTTTVKRYNQSVAAAIMQPSDNVSAKGKVISNPTSSEDATIFFTDTEVSIHAMQAVLVGSASPSVTWTVRYAADRSAAGTEVVTGGTTTTGTTSGSAVTTLNNATIPADNFVWLETTAKSGTVTELGVTVIFGTAGTIAGGGGGTEYPFNWTVIPDLDGLDRNIYVSATGNDSNDGLTDSTPVLTLAAGRTLLRDGHGDRLLLKKGDTFSSQVLFSNFAYSGASAGRPMIFGAYGTGARPIVDSGSSYNFTTNTGVTISHVWIVGLELTSTTYTGSGNRQGIALGFNAVVGDILVEDCYIHEQDVALSVNAGTGRHTNIRVRGNVFHNSYNSAGTGNSHGFLCSNVDTLLVEGCIFNYCGWNETKTGSLPSINSRSMYIQSGAVTAGQSGNTDVTTINNVMLNTDGLQLRCGGVATGNVGSRLRVGIAAGTGNYLQSGAGGIALTCEDNVVLESKTHTGIGGCNAYEIGQIHFSSTFRRNIAGRSIGNHAADDIKSFWFYHPGDSSLSVDAPLDFSSNVFFHSGYLAFSSGTYSTGANVVTFTNNDFQLNPLYADNQCFRCDPSGILDDMVANGNNYFSSTAESGSSTYWGEIAGANTAIATWVGASNLDDTTATFDDHTTGYYVDPERDLGSYYLSIGGSDDHEAFATAILAQSKDNWNSDYTAQAIVAYIKAGFS